MPTKTEPNNAAAYSPDSYRRKMSPIERYYVSCDTQKYPYHTPCLNQMTIEGTGEFDEKAWQEAVKIASLANPGSRLILTGNLGFATWVDSGKTTPVRVVDAGSWNGQSADSAPYLNEPLPAYQGPTSEVLLIKGQQHNYVVFRSHHGVMDGRGTQSFADDVFRALNGEAPLGENSAMSDLDLSLQLTNVRSEMITDEVAAPTGMPDGNEPGRIWIRKTVTGKFSQVLAKAAIGIARSARKHGDTHVRFQLPVDMRPRVEGLRSTANLSGGIMMDVPADMTVARWKDVITEKLANRREAVIPRFLKFIPINLLCWTSLNMMKRSNEKLVAKRKVSGQYRASGIISNLGLLPLQSYQGGGFVASSAFFIPPDFDTTAFFLTLSGNSSGIELVLRLPKTLATKGRLHQVLDDIVAAISHNSDAFDVKQSLEKQKQTSLELSR